MSAAEKTPKGSLARVAKGMQAWLQVDGARLMTDRKGKVVWSNLAAHKALERCGAIRIADGVLASAPDRPGPQFPEVLGRQGESPQDFVVFDVRGRASLLIRSRAVAYEGGMLCGLSLRPAGGEAVCDGPLLRQAFGLTAAEQIVVMAMARGDSPDSIALRGRQSLETVRTHIRHIYGKMSVGSREGLFAKLAPFLSWPEDWERLPSDGAQGLAPAD